MEFPSQKKHQCQAPPQGWALNAFTLTNSGSPFQTMTTPTQHECRSVVSDYLQPHGLHSSCNSPGRNSGMCSLSLLQGIFPTQGSNPGLPHRRPILYQLSYEGSPSNCHILYIDMYEYVCMYLNVCVCVCIFLHI